MAGCLVCASDSSKCTSCNQQLSYYLYETTCYRIASTKDSLVLSTPLLPCSSPACSTCDASQKCLACGPLSHHVLLGFCVLDTNTPAVVGFDLARPGLLDFCTDAECLACRADITVCTQCSASTVLSNNQCGAAPPSNPAPQQTQPQTQPPPDATPPTQTCTLKIKKTSYDNIKREIVVTLDSDTGIGNKNMLDVIDVVVNIRAGNNYYPNLTTEVGYSNNILTVKLSMNTTVYHSNVELALNGKPSTPCAGLAAAARIEEVTVKEMSQLQQTVARTGTSVAVYGTILSIVLTSNRAGVSNLLDKLMSSFIWMKVLNGPELFYPRLLLNYMTFKKSAIFGISNPFEKIGEECDLAAQYARSGIACNFLINFGDDLVFIIGCFAVGLILYGIKRAVSSLLRGPKHTSHLLTRDRPAARKLTNKVELKQPASPKPKSHWLLVLVCCIEDSIGVKYSLNEVHSNLMEFLSYAVIHLTAAISTELWPLIGAVASGIAILYFLLLNYVEYKFLRYHRATLLQPAAGKPLLSVTEAIEQDPPTVWNVISYAHESSQAPRKPVYLYTLYFEHLRVCLVSTALFFMVRVGAYQVFFAFAMQLAYVVLLVDAREKRSKFELTVTCITASLELAYSALKLSSFFIDDKHTLEEVIGLWLAVVLGLMVAVNLLFVTWELLLVVVSVLKYFCSRKKVSPRKEKAGQEAFKGRNDLAKPTTVGSLKKRFPRKTFVQRSSMTTQKSPLGRFEGFACAPVTEKKGKLSFSGNRTPTSSTKLMNFECSARVRKPSLLIEEDFEVLPTASPLAPRSSQKSPARISHFSPSRKDRVRHATIRLQLLAKNPTCSPTNRLEELNPGAATSPLNFSKAIGRSYSPIRRIGNRKDSYSELEAEKQIQVSDSTLNEADTSNRGSAGKKHPPRPRVSSTSLASKRHLNLNEESANR